MEFSRLSNDDKKKKDDNETPMLYGSPTKRQRAFLLLILADVHVCMYIYIYGRIWGEAGEM